MEAIHPEPTHHHFICVFNMTNLNFDSMENVVLILSQNVLPPVYFSLCLRIRF